MKEFWQKLLQKMKNPPAGALIAVYILTAVSIVGAIGILFVDYQGTFLEFVAYALFALAALSLAYTTYTLIKVIPQLKRWFLQALDRYEFTRAIKNNYGHRTVIFAIGTFLMSVAYSAFNAYLGISSRSIWYGALATYYIFLALIRGGILTYHRKKRAGVAENPSLMRAKTYRTSGALMVVLNTALSAAIAQMIFDDRFFSYADWTVFAMAAYAFFKITMSILNFLKARKQDDLTIEAIRNINLVDATVSILALQTALLHAFGTGEVDVSLFNTLTGSVVSVVALTVGVYMVVKGNKEIRKERRNGKQEI